MKLIKIKWHFDLPQEVIENSGLLVGISTEQFGPIKTGFFLQLTISYLDDSISSCMLALKNYGAIALPRTEKIGPERNWVDNQRIKAKSR